MALEGSTVRLGIHIEPILRHSPELPVFGHIVYSLRYILLTIRDSTQLHSRLSMPLSITACINRRLRLKVV